MADAERSPRPRSVPVRVGDEVVVEVEAFGDGADAVCRMGGYVLLVPFVLPGERVAVRVTSAARKFGRAVPRRLLRAASERVEPRCRHFGRCGGCDLQHVADSAQHEAKVARLQKTLRHALRRDDVVVEPMVAPADPWRTRTKLALHFSGAGATLRAGFFAVRSRDLEPVEECPVHDPLGLRIGMAARDALAAAGAAAWRPRTGRGEVRAVVVRSAPATGDAHATLVLRRRGPLDLDALAAAVLAAGASGVAWNPHSGPPQHLLGHELVALAGRQQIVDRVGEVEMVVSPGAFFQTSSRGARALVELVPEAVAAPASATVVDLYCGGGLLSLALAKHVRTVIGVEQNATAIADARASAARNGIRNLRLHQGPAEGCAAALRGERPFAVVLDPPRAGCTPSVLAAISGLGPRRIVYVSCEPVSFARDAAWLERHGYRLGSVRPLDMFPHTHHLEAVAVFRRD